MYSSSTSTTTVTESSPAGTTTTTTTETTTSTPVAAVSEALPPSPADPRLPSRLAWPKSTVAIPEGEDDLTPQWLEAVLKEGGNLPIGVTVASVDKKRA
jgi:hypothetical protein